MPMKISGNAKSATIRWRSRNSLMKSRWARARIAEASLTSAAHDLEVRVLEARRVGLHDAQRCLDASQDGVDGVTVELDLEWGAPARRMTEPRELVAQSGSVGRVDEHVFLDEVPLDVCGSSERHDLALVDDADAVGLFGLLEIVRGEEDRGAARPPNLGEVLPEGAARRDVKAGRRLVEEQDLRVMQEAPHDLELPSHAAGKRLHGLVDVPRDTEQLRELLHLRAIAAGHEAVGRRVREDAVQDGVEAHILLGREVLVEAWPLKDDPDLAPHRARLPGDVAAVDRRAATCRGERRCEDRDHGRLPRPVRTEEDEELSRLHLEGDPVDGVRLGLLVPLHEIFDANHALSI